MADSNDDAAAASAASAELEKLFVADGSSSVGGEKRPAGKDRAAVKAERLAARGAKSTAAVAEDDPLAANYGDTPLVQSACVSGRVWTRLAALGPELAGQRVLVRGRVHAVRGKGKSAFLILRQQTSTLQVIFFVDEASVSKGMVKYVCALPKESVLDLEGVVTVPETAITGASVPVELAACTVRCVSRALPALPFDLEDASRPDGAETDAHGVAFPKVGADTRLDNRVLDLRTPANQAIFRLQSAVGALFREALSSRGFIEIHTPKLIAGASEGGASVFKLSYMGQPACLAQSPQLYKQARAAGAALRRRGDDESLLCVNRPSGRTNHVAFLLSHCCALLCSPPARRRPLTPLAPRRWPSSPTSSASLR
jgi:aspartyl-tRNA synthetase